MSVATVITLGYGSYGSPSYVVLLGYGNFTPIPPAPSIVYEGERPRVRRMEFDDDADVLEIIDIVMRQTGRIQ